MKNIGSEKNEKRRATSVQIEQVGGPEENRLEAKGACALDERRWPKYKIFCQLCFREEDEEPNS